MSDAQTLAHMFIGFNGPSLQQLKKDIENGSKEFGKDWWGYVRSQHFRNHLQSG